VHRNALKVPEYNFAGWSQSTAGGDGVSTLDNCGFVAGAALDRKLVNSRSRVNPSPGTTAGAPTDQGEMPDAVHRLAQVAAGILPVRAALERGR
jgi:hypothetical protein